MLVNETRIGLSDMAHMMRNTTIVIE